MKRVTIASAHGGSFPAPAAGIGTLRERRSPSRLSSTRCTKAASAAAASVLDCSLPLHARVVSRIEGIPIHGRTCLLDRGGDRRLIRQKLLSGYGYRSDSTSRAAGRRQPSWTRCAGPIVSPREI